MKKQKNVVEKSQLPSISPTSSRPTTADASQSEVSILDFDQDSKNVIFTEPQTIEAIKRLGLTFNDFSCKKPSNFRRPGCDDSVAQLLYSKYESKRQHYIEQVTKMRESILAENMVVKQDDPIIRVQKQMIKKEQEQFEQMRKSGEADLRKIVVCKFRDLFQKQIHVEAMEKTLKRTSAIEEVKQIQTRSVQSRGASVLSMRHTSPSLNELQNTDTTQQFIAKRISEEQLRAKKIKHMEDQIQQVLLKGQQRKDEQAEKRANQARKEEERFIHWQKVQNEQEKVNQKKNQTQNNRKQEIALHAQKIEEERRQAYLAKLSSEEARMKQRTQNNSIENAKRMEASRKKLLERSQRVHEYLEEKRAQEDRERKRQDQTTELVAKRLKERAKSQSLQFLQRQLDREERIEKAQRLFAGRQYLADKRAFQEITISTEAEILNTQKRKLMSQRIMESTNYKHKRETLLAAFNQMDSLDDQKAMANIRSILGISEEDFQQIIESAKNQATNQTRPGSSINNRVP